MFQYDKPHRENGRKKRQAAAQTRQAAYSALSLREKIALVKSRPGHSKRELARLEAQLAKETI